MKTYAPSSTKSLAVASAMPEVAAVMTAVFPSSFPMNVPLFCVVIGGKARCYFDGSGLPDWLAEAAAGAEQLAGDPFGVVGGEEGGDGSDVIDLADAAKRCLRDDTLLEVGAEEACSVYAFGLDHAGVDGVDADLFRAELFGENA